MRRRQIDAGQDAGRPDLGILRASSRRGQDRYRWSASWRYACVGRWIASAFFSSTQARWRHLEAYTATFSGGPSGSFTATVDVGTFNTAAAAVTGEAPTCSARLRTAAMAPAAVDADAGLSRRRAGGHRLVRNHRRGLG